MVKKRRKKEEEINNFFFFFLEEQRNDHAPDRHGHACIDDFDLGSFSKVDLYSPSPPSV